MEASINRSVLNSVVRAIEQTSETGKVPVTMETRLDEDLNLGRAGRKKIGMSIEEVFDIELSDEVLERALVVADLVSHLAGHYYRDIDNSRLTEASGDVIIFPALDWRGGTDRQPWLEAAAGGRA